MKSLQESMRESENKKRSLEESVDALREECAKLKAAEKVTSVNAEEKQKAEQLRVEFVDQMDELRDAHTKQVASLRDEISEKQEQINELKEYGHLRQSSSSILISTCFFLPFFLLVLTKS
jgi:kinesin family member 5